MSSVYSRQNELHRRLNAFVNRCGETRFARLVGLISPKLAHRLGAESISRAYVDLVQELSPLQSESAEVTIRQYDGSCQFVGQLMSGLQSLQDDLIGAYVHGSLATHEAINYSDFDGLVILKSDTIRDPRRLASTAAELAWLQKVMIQFDPLQHHGWFVLTEADLHCYCDAFFPLELFRHSKSLLEDNGRTLTVFSRESRHELETAFESVSTAVIRKTSTGPEPRSLYELKSLTSQFMLLPALYVQAAHGRGVYKRDSFDLARRDFPADVWKIMDAVSEIRLNWPASEESVGLRMLARAPVLWHRYIARRMSPQIPGRIRDILTRDFYDSMRALAEAMRERVNIDARRT